MKRSFDVIVVGAGVAGKAAARRLEALGARVVLVDRGGATLPDRHRSRGPRGPGSVLHVAGTARLAGPGRVEVMGVRGRTSLHAPSIILATGSTPVEPRVAGGDRASRVPSRRPCLDELGLDGLGVERDSDGFLRVDDRCRTRVPGLFAAGDVTGPPFIVDKAEEEAEVAALAAMGKPARVRS